MRGPAVVAVRLFSGVAGALMMAAGVWIVANAWSLRGSVNELQEAFAVLFATTVFLIPGACLLYVAVRRRERSPQDG